MLLYPTARGFDAGDGNRYSVSFFGGRPFAERFIQPELLDSAEPEEARVNLDDLMRINRHFGGHTVIRKTLARVVEAESAFSLLDVGAASGDTARVIQQSYPLASIVNLDYNVNNLKAAGTPKLLADAFALPFPDGSFDFVMCCLFLHHFTDAEVVQLLKGFYRVARRAVLVCDLERNILPYLFLPATKALFRWQRLTLHDGPISVRAAFRKSEFVRLAKQAGMRKVQVSAYRPAFRLAMVAER